MDLLEWMELCPGMDEESVESLWIQIKGRARTVFTIECSSHTAQAEEVADGKGRENEEQPAAEENRFCSKAHEGAQVQET
ncbi:hypothetical protein BTVI_09500 [Pitangus sulphuratus]|nr:hypothetical protein BTVI_09500 [Pitangus sulphuratus]